MKKRTVFAVIALCVCCLLSACASGNGLGIEEVPFTIKRSYEANGKKGVLRYECYRSTEGEGAFEAMLVRTEEERAQAAARGLFFERKLSEDKLGENYFETRGIIFAYFKYSSSERDMYVSKVENRNGTVAVTFDVASPAECDADLNADLYLIEVERSLLEGAAAVTYEINNTLINTNSCYYYRGGNAA